MPALPRASSLLEQAAGSRGVWCRPETVESLFIAWRLTGDPQYRQWGWEIFEAIEAHCRVASGGYASVLNVDALPVALEDKMETFLMVRGRARCAATGETDRWWCCRARR